MNPGPSVGLRETDHKLNETEFDSRVLQQERVEGIDTASWLGTPVVFVRGVSGVSSLVGSLVSLVGLCGGVRASIQGTTCSPGNALGTEREGQIM